MKNKQKSTQVHVPYDYSLFCCVFFYLLLKVNHWGNFLSIKLEYSSSRKVTKQAFTKSSDLHLVFPLVVLG